MMTDPTSRSKSAFNIDAEHRQHIRLWPQQQPTRRLVLLTLLGGTVLTILGALAFWQVIHEFSLINTQQQRQEAARNVLRTLTGAGALLRQGANMYVDLVRTHEADRRADISGAMAELTENRQAISALMDNLDSLFRNINLTRDDLREYQQLRKDVDFYLLSRESMIDEYLAGEDIQKYYIALDHLQDLRVKVADDVTRLRTNIDPTVDAVADSINIELKRTFLVSCAALGGSGLVVLVLGWMLVRYAHKRDQVEADLRRTTDLWLGIIETLKQGVALYGYDKRLILWNPRYAELNGIDPGKLYVGIPAEEVIRNSIQRKGRSLEIGLERFNRNIEVVKRGEAVERELPRVDGVQIQLSFYPMGPDLFVTTLTDMTQVRQAEQLASEQAIRLGTIMNNVPDAIVTINASGSIESWNAAAERMFGYAASEIIHRNVSVLMNEPHASQHDYYIQRYLKEGDKATLGRLREFTARRHDGTEFPMDLRISEMELGDKRMFTGIIRDITERRAVEQMKNEFISTVSHELRTPLTSIIGSHALLIDGVGGDLPDKARQLIGMAEKNSQRLGRLINDILDLEKAEAGRMNLQLEVIELLPLLQHSLDINQSYAASFDVELRLQSQADPVSVRADEVRVLQVMSNLLSNAIKHSPPHSTVLVDVALANDLVRVTVHDAGPGIAEEFKSRVFLRFAQADSSNTRRVAGSGLGLAITKQLVELHGGSIGFDTGRSQVGTGSGASFWFELPVVKAMSVERAGPGTGGPLNMKLVLCEDDPDVAEVLIEMLRLEGCKVRHLDTSSGVRALLDDSVSALLVDIDLPDIDGLNLVAELRRDERWRNLPVLVVSGKYLTVDEQAAHAGLCIRAWLGKPVDRGALRSALSDINS